MRSIVDVHYIDLWHFLPKPLCYALTYLNHANHEIFRWSPSSFCCDSQILHTNQPSLKRLPVKLQLFEELNNFLKDFLKCWSCSLIIRSINALSLDLLLISALIRAPSFCYSIKVIWLSEIGDCDCCLNESVLPFGFL